MHTTTEIRREVMTLAWRKLRWERSAMRRAGYRMGEALRHAWAWVKGAADRAASEVAAKAAWVAAQGRITHLRSPVSSPIRRSLGAGRYARATAYQAAYTTARVGY
jgi:hypothetical protein